jgi:uncharacterized membrane protein YdjX (TVP38/TMEM64 family)
MHLKVSRTNSVCAAVAIALAVAIYFFVPEVNSSLHRLADGVVNSDLTQAIQAFREYLLSFGVWAPVISACLMVILQVFLLPIPTFFVTLTNGLLFGWALGAALSWSSSIVGAAICYWIARSLGRPVVERLTGGAHGMEVLDLFFSRYGNRAVLIARLLPFLSFRVVSYGIGLTPVRVGSFLVATGVGQLPATLAYSYLGQNLTGTLRVLFLVLCVTTALLIAGWMAGPAVLRRLRAGGENTVKESTP